MSEQFPRPDKVPHTLAGSEPRAGQHCFETIPSTVLQTRGNCASVESGLVTRPTRPSTRAVIIFNTSCPLLATHKPVCTPAHSNYVLNYFPLRVWNHICNAPQLCIQHLATVINVISRGTAWEKVHCDPVSLRNIRKASNVCALYKYGQKGLRSWSRGNHLTHEDYELDIPVNQWNASGQNTWGVG